MVVPSREMSRKPSKPSRSRNQRCISSPTIVAVEIGWSPVLTRVSVTCIATWLQLRRHRRLGRPPRQSLGGLYAPPSELLPDAGFGLQPFELGLEAAERGVGRSAPEQRQQLAL